MLPLPPVSEGPFLGRQSRRESNSSVFEWEIVFWQRMVAIHQAPLIVALAARPGVKVTYVAEEMVGENRRALGWHAPFLGAATLVIVNSPERVASLLPTFSGDAVHVCQGFRSNGLVGVAQEYLRKRGAHIFIVTETVDDRGLVGIIKRFWYALCIMWAKHWVDSVLAIGEKTSTWFGKRGFPTLRIFPFCYFLDASHQARLSCDVENVGRPFHFAFIGSFIRRKRLDLLIDALAGLVDGHNFRITIVGAGPLEDVQRRLAFDRLGERVVWRGLLPASEISPLLAEVDCLVLPSQFDGWGCVVSEALLAGTPAICSDTCGAAGVVRYSQSGGVFRADDREALQACLLQAVNRGVVRGRERAALANWAMRCIGGTAGASYFMQILRNRFEGCPRPDPPMLNARSRPSRGPQFQSDIERSTYF